MLIGDSPFEGDDEEELFDEILRKKLSYPARLGKESSKMLDAFLTRDPNKRLGCGRNGRADIVAHAFFAGLDWDKLEKREVSPETATFWWKHVLSRSLNALGSR